MRSGVAAAALAATAAAAAASSSATAAAAAAAAPLGARARARGAHLASLVGDALSLQSHYEYDARVIHERVAGGSSTDFGAPLVNYGVGWGRANYHPGKVSGDNTDAGDFAIMLLESVAANGNRFSFDAYAAFCYDEINIRKYGSCNFQTVGREATACPPGTRPGYLNGGLRRTLEALAAHRGAPPTGDARKRLAANVNCLIAATHWFPLLALRSTYAGDEAALVRDATESVFLSHNNHDPIAAAGFLARAAHRLVFRGERDLAAVLEAAAAETGDAFISARLAEARAKVAEARDASTPLAQQGRFTDDTAITSLARLWDVGKSEPIKVGKASPTEGALPAALYFALRYEDSLERALVANADCGGDSAARAMVIGMLLGGLHGEAAVPARWAEGLRVRDKAERLWAQLEASGGWDEEKEL